MTKQEVDILHEAMEKMLEECDVNEHDFKSEIVKGYSGRGMYGKETYGLVINSFTSLLQAIMTFPELLYDKHEGNSIATNNIITKFRTDQLGLSIIIY
ncbi:hypothetical protein [Crocosphaera sp. Alani8]|uniref:hypothetical protein n=1 Tax=Crocosphaera sp. Alani8 TaxID=3038952 RepID=UPI00313D6CD4